jgi:nucleoside-diphosphate-sugar epimerase
MVIERVSILGCGWFGQPLGARLVADGLLVNGSTTRPDKTDGLKAAGIKPHVLRFDPSFDGDVASDFFDCDIMVVAISPKTKQKGAEFYHQQLAHVTQAVVRAEIKWVIFISSTSVYPSSGREVFEEDADLTSALGVAEKILCDCSTFATTVLRFGGLIGPGRHPGRFLAGKEVEGGDDPVNVVHLNDCVNITAQIIQLQKRNETYNVCADEHPSRREFYTAAAAQLALPLPVFKGGKVGFKIVSNHKVRQHLNYDFEYSNPMKMIR